MYVCMYVMQCSAVQCSAVQRSAAQWNGMEWNVMYVYIYREWGATRSPKIRGFKRFFDCFMLFSSFDHHI